MGKKNKKRRSNRGVYLTQEAADVAAALEGDDGMAVHVPDSIKKGTGARVGTGQPAQAVHYPQYHGQQSWGNSSGQTWGSGYISSSCKHNGDVLVFEHNGKKLFAANWQGLDEYSGKWKLIIDLADNVKPPSNYRPAFVRSISTNPIFKELDQYTTHEEPKQLKSELLSLNWTDMGAPPVTLDFWLRLWDILPETSVIACMGGHGRTGTCLASLEIAAGVDYYTAVEDIRAVHCTKAIESFAQEKYLHAIYVDYLTRQLDICYADPAKWSGDIKDYEADLAYANENPPSLNKPVGSKVTPVTSSVTETVKVDGVNIKRMNGKLWYRECVDPKCTQWKCDDINHLGWVSEDSRQEMMFADL